MYRKDTSIFFINILKILILDSLSIENKEIKPFLNTDRTLDGIFCPYVFVGDGSVAIWVSEVPDHNITLESLSFEKVV